MVDDLLAEAQIRRRGLFRPERVRAFVEEHRRGVQDWSMQIWQFLTLELWSRVFLDGGSRRLAADTIQAQRAATA
jgi:asparagine synthase (glutamine-hydrolysing)